MGSSRERGFSVTPERLAFIEQKMREMGIDSRGALAEATKLSPDVIYKKLFSGRNIDRSTVKAIADTLKIQPTEIIESERWYRRSKNAKSQASTNIDWHYVCRTMLDRQKKLSTNEVIASEAMQFDLLDDEIFISLALVERKEPERLSQNVHPARPIEQYEEKPPIEYEQFREEILRQGKSDCIAIVGEPGAGKTTLLQHIAFSILDKELGLPIWISLGDLIKNGDLQRLKDYLTQVWLDDAVSDVTQDVKSDFLKQLNQQRVWLLLDGADEIVASSGIALREINNQLRGWLTQSSIILTCRINVWEIDINALRDFQTYRTKQFHYPTQVEQFIESGFRKSNRQSGERLKIELANTEHTRLQQLVRNPLRLMMLCTTWQEQETLPATKAELYKRFVSEFYKWNRSKWKKKDLNYALFPNTVVKQEKLNKALGRLACRALDEESSPFRLPHNLVSGELGAPDEDGSDFWLALNLGWLQVARDSDKPSDKVYTFFHPTFQEYFAACAIDDWGYFLNHRNKNSKLFPNYKVIGNLFSPQYLDYFAGQEIGKWTNFPSHNNKNYNQFLKDNKEDCLYRIFELPWKEVILLWMGREGNEQCSKQKEELIEALMEFEDDCMGFYSFHAYFLAAACIAEFRSCTQSDDIVAQIVEWSLGYSEDNPIGKAAMAVLPTTDCIRVYNYLDELEDACDNDWDDDPSIMKKEAITLAYATLSGYNPNEPWEDNLTSIENFPDEYLTENALLEQVKFNIKEIQNQPNEIFGLIKNIDALTELLSSPDQALRLNAASSLGQISAGNLKAINDAIDVLIEILCSSQERTTITSATSSLLAVLPEHLYMKVVTGLKKCMGTHQFLETPTHGQPFADYENNFYRFKCCYSILLHCAEKLLYLDFYQAWHQTTIH